MKVLLVNKYHFLKGGAEKYYFTLADALKKNGDEVIFFSVKSNNNLPCQQETHFVTDIFGQKGAFGKIKAIKSLVYSKEAYQKMRNLLIKEKPDLVILNNIHKQLTCSIIDAIKDYRFELPIFWITHDLATICPAYIMRNGHGEICEQCLDKNFSHCIKNKCIHNSYFKSFLSARESKIIRKKGWLNKVDVYITPSKFYQEKLKQAQFTNAPIIWERNPLPIDTNYKLCFENKNYLIYFGRLSAEKGIRLLIDSIKTRPFTLKIVGSGPQEKELKLYCQENNITNVHFEGFKSGSELEKYIDYAKAIILPSQWYENGPYSAMEAMAKGKPLIVSNFGGLPELVENGNNGFIFKNQNELSLSIDQLYQLNDDQYRSLCLSSLEKAKCWFNPNDYVHNIHKLFDDLKFGTQK